MPGVNEQEQEVLMRRKLLLLLAAYNACQAVVNMQSGQSHAHISVALAIFSASHALFGPTRASLQVSSVATCMLRLFESLPANRSVKTGHGNTVAFYPIQALG